MIYAVNVPVRVLCADVDQLRNQRLYAKRLVGDSVAESIAFGHGVQIKGAIPPYLISVHSGLEDHSLATDVEKKNQEPGMVLRNRDDDEDAADPADDAIRFSA